jgi:hypothetical protein
VLWWLSGSLLLLALLALAVNAQEQPREYRVDLFDRNSNRQGYVIVNPKTGRLDSYDRRSNRVGSGQVRPAPVPGTAISTSTKK